MLCCAGLSHCLPEDLFIEAGVPCRNRRMSRPRLIAESRRRVLKLPLEGPVESSFRFVPHFRCNLRYRITGRGKHLRPQLEPPAREVGHRGLIEVTTKAFRKY